MGSAFVLTSITSNSTSANTENVTAGFEAFVAPGVYVIDEAGNGSDAIYVDQWGYADIQGSVSGPTGLFFSGVSPNPIYTTSVHVGATGSITATYHAALVVANGTYAINNAGEIQNLYDDGVELDYSGGVSGAGGTAGSGGGTLVNTGTISSVLGAAVYNGDASGADTDVVTNYGKIVSTNGAALDDAAGHHAVVNNYGDIAGASTDAVVASGSEQLTNSGTISGAVDLGVGSSVSDSGTIDGEVTIANGTNSLVISVVSVASTGVIDGGLANDALYTFGSNYQITNAGAIKSEEDGSYAVQLGAGSGWLINTGEITSAGASVDNFAAPGGDDYIFNSGTISGTDYGVEDTGGHTTRVVNQGVISSGSPFGDAIYTDATTKERLVNSGTISGAVALGAASSTIVNSGSIDGNIAFGSGSGRFVNSGSVDGNISFTGTGNVYLGKGGSFTGTLTGTGIDGRYYAGAGVENFDFSATGAAIAVGGTGETTFDYGAKYTTSMTVQGGSGTTIVDLEGNYIGNSGAIFLGARAMVGIDKIVFGAGFSYSLSVNAATVQNGATMTVDASAVGAGQTATLNISKDVGGFYDFVGGVGTDTIVAAANNLFANDVLLGGTNGANAINFKTAGTVLSPSFGNVSGFSTINLASGTNDIQLNDVMVNKANASHTLIVNASYGADTIDFSLLITNSNIVIVNALNSSGGDNFLFGAAKETVNLGAGISTSVNYDTISNFTFGTTLLADNLTVQGYTPNMIDAAVSGSLSTATFDADLATALAGHLNNGDALLFTANAGTLAGDTFLIASTNGSAGYAAGDLVVRLTGTTTGTLAVGNV